MKRFVTITLFLISCSIVLGQDQNFDKKKLDSLLTYIDVNQKGMHSISIFENGKEVYQNSIGFADVSNKIMANGHTKYRIGSISKTFTAVLIMKLIENGKLDLNTKLSDFFPSIQNSDKITIEHLLRHRSGIFNFTNAKDYSSWMEKPISHEALIEKIKENGIVFEPDSKAEYSNSNYVLLSQISEKVTRKKFADLIQDVICKPCGLTSTGYGGKIDPKHNEALSYKWSGNWELASETDMSVPAGAGAITSTPSELNKFLTCLFGNHILPEPTLETMMKIVDGYGIGMFQVPFNEKKGYGHTGGIDGFQSNAFFFPKEKMSVAFTGNGQIMSMNDILIGALSIYFNKEYKFPEFKEVLVLEADELNTYLGTYGSESFPLKIKIFKKENILYGQATGQPEFPMDALGEHQFRFEPAGLKITFAPNENTLVLYQGGGEFKLQREEKN
nr:serine hydrolase domain-containing protein [uncultured Allomuricauda sp.]